MGCSGEGVLSVLLPANYRLTGNGNESCKWKCWGEGYCPSHPTSEAGCGSCWEGNCWSAGWEQELLIPPASRQSSDRPVGQSPREPNSRKLGPTVYRPLFYEATVAGEAEVPYTWNNFPRFNLGWATPFIRICCRRINIRGRTGRAYLL